MPTPARVRAFLKNGANRRIPITYQELAKALQILPPHSIHRVTEALERLMEEDAAADRPFIAALVISKARGGLPAPGFFDCARRLGRFAGNPDGQECADPCMRRQPIVLSHCVPGRRPVVTGTCAVRAVSFHTAPKFIRRRFMVRREASPICW